MLLAVAAGCRAEGQATTSVVMLSDLHFDPLRDPGKAARLAAAPVERWDAILSEPDSAEQAVAFKVMQKGCGARGVDSDARLIAESLREAASHAGGAGLVVVSGDLLVHGFGCRYRMALKGDQGFRAFAEKTANYVIEHVERAFPGLPVYFALGNNDSGCGDYQSDVHDHFFAATSGLVLRGMVGAGPQELAEARKDYEAEGNYSVTLHGMRGIKLLIVNANYLSTPYKTCRGDKDVSGADATVAWLGRMLERARSKGEQVWVMGHIPPGVNVFTTLLRMRDVCGTQRAEMFLGSDELNGMLAKHASLVKLAIFGHTHMDELRVIESATVKGVGVPVKLIASISPVDGNLPSFTVGVVDRASGSLRDYTVFVAGDKTGTGAWKSEYSFGESYGGKEFTFPMLAGLVESFSKDGKGTEGASVAYQREFFKGGMSPLGLIWPQAVCAMKEQTSAGYKSCLCGTSVR